MGRIAVIVAKGVAVGIVAVSENVGLHLPGLCKNKGRMQENLESFGVGAMTGLTTVHFLQEAFETLAPGMEFSFNLPFTAMEVHQNGFWWLFGLCLIIGLVNDGLGHGVEHAHNHIKETEPVSYSTQCHLKEISQCNVAAPKRSQVFLFLAILPLCVHSLLEGLMLGISDQAFNIISVALALAMHKWVEGLIVATVIGGYSRAPIIAWIFMCACPLGIMLGTVLPISKTVEGFIDLMGCCSLMVIALTMGHDLFNGFNNCIRVFMIVAGFATICIVTCIHHALE